MLDLMAAARRSRWDEAFEPTAIRLQEKQISSYTGTGGRATFFLKRSCVDATSGGLGLNDGLDGGGKKISLGRGVRTHCDETAGEADTRTRNNTGAYLYHVLVHSTR